LVKNLVNRQQLLFTKTEWHSKFGSRLCKIRWEKHYGAFVKVVEGSEIYNFPIHHKVYFNWDFLSYTQSNRGNQHRSTPERERARQAAPALGVQAPGPPPEVAPPEAPRFPKRSHALRRLEVTPTTCRALPCRPATRCEPPVPPSPRFGARRL
jgi:hypothetical protein